MELLEMMCNRRSVRRYTGAPVSEEDLRKILQAGLLSASGHAARPWELVVVRNKDTLKALSDCRVGSAKMLEHADCAVVVLGDPEKSNVWTEDCSGMMTNMHLMADSLGVGSCWIQGRLREAPDGSTTEDYVRRIIGFPASLRLEAILSLGMPEVHPQPHTLEDVDWSRVHAETY